MFTKKNMERGIYSYGNRGNNVGRLDYAIIKASLYVRDLKISQIEMQL